jgi:hypothetical protein
MTTETKTKPGYLGLLNAISLGESRAGVYLNAWADVTPDQELAACLRLVAARETNHGETFCRRIREFGFDVMERPDPNYEETLARLGNPAISDAEKIKRQDGEGGDDPFKGIEEQLEQGIFDPLTASMLRWYIGEERDSGDILKQAYARVRANSNGATGGVSADTQAIIACMSQGFDRLQACLTEIRSALPSNG